MFRRVSPVQTEDGFRLLDCGVQRRLSAPRVAVSPEAFFVKAFATGLTIYGPVLEFLMVATEAREIDVALGWNLSLGWSLIVGRLGVPSPLWC